MLSLLSIPRWGPSESNRGRHSATCYILFAYCRTDRPQSAPPPVRGGRVFVVCDRPMMTVNMGLDRSLFCASSFSPHNGVGPRPGFEPGAPNARATCQRGAANGL